MQNTIKKIFSLEEIPQPHDAADALAMAYIVKKKFN
jgi:Holliday junction resolvasome RuvABC endonuclease subunit